MCTTIATTFRVSGTAKGPTGWAAIDEADIGYDHATRLWTEHAVRLDLRSSAAPGADHVAIELDLASREALLDPGAGDDLVHEQIHAAGRPDEALRTARVPGERERRALQVQAVAEGLIDTPVLHAERREPERVELAGPRVVDLRDLWEDARLVEGPDPEVVAERVDQLLEEVARPGRAD